MFLGKQKIKILSILTLGLFMPYVERKFFDIFPLSVSHNTGVTIVYGIQVLVSLIGIYIGRSYIPTPRIQASFLRKILVCLGYMVFILTASVMLEKQFNVTMQNSSKPVNLQKKVEPEEIYERKIWHASESKSVWAAPIVEESLLRFGLMHVALGNLPTSVAIILSNAIFTLAHYQVYKWQGLIPVFLIGFCLSIVFLSYGLKWSIFCHSMMNAYAVTGMFGYNDRLLSAILSNFFLSIATAGLLLVALWFFLINFWKLAKRR